MKVNAYVACALWNTYIYVFCLLLFQNRMKLNTILIFISCRINPNALGHTDWKSAKVCILLCKQKEELQSPKLIASHSHPMPNNSMSDFDSSLHTKCITFSWTSTHCTKPPVSRLLRIQYSSINNRTSWRSLQTKNVSCRQIMSFFLSPL